MTQETSANLEELRQKAEAEQANVQKITATETVATPTRKASGSWWSVTDAMTISASVLIFAVVVLCLTAYAIRLTKNPEAVLRVFGTMIIVLAAVFLVVAGYTDTQIAPVIGLLGTIAGYLLGKESKQSVASNTPEDSKRP